MADNYSSKGRIFIVDADPVSVSRLQAMLKGYTVVTFPDGGMALIAASKTPPGLILLNARLFGMDGFQICQRLKAQPQTANIPVLMIVDHADPAVLQRARQAGALDCIAKPFLSEDILAKVDPLFAPPEPAGPVPQAPSAFGHLQEAAAAPVAEPVAASREVLLALVHSLVNITEERKAEMMGHAERVREYCRLLSGALRATPAGARVITDEFQVLLPEAAILHDIGKGAVAESIVLKSGTLTEDEFEKMKQHTLIGAGMLEAILRDHPGDAFLRMAIEIARAHHERWDGAGYPHGWTGDAIPLSARILAVADVYDILRSPRNYKGPLRHETACRVIAEGAGTQFDPAVVEAFARVGYDFKDIGGE